MDINEKILLIRGLELLKVTIKTGSYTKTAEKLRSQQSNISTKIRQVEEYLGVKLFSKTSHGVVPTHEGKEINAYAEKIDALLYELHNFSCQSHCISGDIKVWTTDGIGICLMPNLVDFQNRYPKVCLNFICSNEMPSFTDREADVAIVYSEPKSGEPVKTNEYNIKFGLFASSEYEARYGLPKNLEDLVDNHRICDRNEYINTWNEWRNLIKRARHVVSWINSTNLLIQSGKQGMGLSLHPINYGKVEKDLIPVPIDLNLEHKCWVVSHYDDQNVEKINELLKYIDKAMQRL